MVKFIKFFMLFIFSLTVFFKAFSQEKEIDIKKLSEAIGNIIGKNLDDLGFKSDLKEIIKGIKKGFQNEPSVMDDDELIQALAQILEKENEKKALKNLQDAINFLKDNLNDNDVIELEKEKLQYKILKTGKDNKVETYHTPIVKMTGKYLGGKVFVNSKETVDLEEIPIVLKHSIIGMHLNEKRQVFIHPDLIFDESFSHLNSLVIFDIEILDLDAKKDPLEIASRNVF